MTIEEYFGDWLKVLDKKSLIEVTNRVMALAKTKPICPDISNIFKAFEVCPYKDLKIVMLGQDFWLFYISNLFIKLFCLVKFRIFVIIKIAKI